MKISISAKSMIGQLCMGQVGDLSFVFVLVFAVAFVLAFVFVFAWPKRMVGQLWMGVAGRSVTLTFVRNYFLVSPNVSCTGHPARFR